MTKLKEETNKLENAVTKLKNELEKLNKPGIKENIAENKNLKKILEELLENEELQKKYPKYNKLKKLFYILPSGIVTLLTVILILISILLNNITFTTFLPVLLLAADYITYHASTKICDKKIAENERLKPFFELYGDKQYSAKRTLKDVRDAEKALGDNEALLEECKEKEQRLSSYERTLAKLYNIRDNFVEQTLGDQYQQEIKNITSEIEIEPEAQATTGKPKQYIKKNG